ncbi:MAG TPA: hypothetical protein DHU78_05670 [Opitutae bacterium]|nr:hypothetical protein [Opitutae bacterium]|tara:strand:- start:582 stop:1322 length:741 start_codon:yes stop_codon:yes gene_type:complete
MKPKILTTFALLGFFFLGACSEGDPSGEEVDVFKIVGEPILEDSNKKKDPDINESRALVSQDPGTTTAKIEPEEVEVFQGVVVDGKKTTDENQSFVEDFGTLPPLEPDGAYRSIAFRELTDFDYSVEWEKDGKEFEFSAYAQRVPKKLRKISNTKVAIEGFMIPTIVDENNELKEFLLLPDQMSCCFGQTPEANGWVVVSAEQGAEVMMDRIIRITGELAVEERWDEEFFVGLYHIVCDEITGPSL